MRQMIEHGAWASMTHTVSTGDAGNRAGSMFPVHYQVAGAAPPRAALALATSNLHVIFLVMPPVCSSPGGKRLLHDKLAFQGCLLDVIGQFFVQLLGQDLGRTACGVEHLLSRRAFLDAHWLSTRKHFGGLMFEPPSPFEPAEQSCPPSRRGLCSQKRKREGIEQDGVGGIALAQLVLRITAAK